jgi:hypothetical protein
MGSGGRTLHADFQGLHLTSLEIHPQIVHPHSLSLGDSDSMLPPQ